MKRYVVAVLVLGIISLCGCSKGTSKNINENSVDKVLKEQTAGEEEMDNQAEKVEKQFDEQGQAKEADIDLTEMSSDMVYATVYQILSDPNSYVGKTIRAKGVYTASNYEETGQYYHFVVIADAAACCSQGLEFVWGDGTHVYPDEYPQEQAEIIVTGTFETYTEGEEETMYAHLNHASLELVK